MEEGESQSEDEGQNNGPGAGDGPSVGENGNKRKSATVILCHEYTII